MIKQLVLTILLFTCATRAADLQLGWNAPVSTDGPLGYKLWIAVPGAAFVNVSTTTNTSLTLTNITPAAWRFYVTAYTLSTNTWALESDPSNILQLPAATKPGAPVVWLMFLKTP